MVLSLHVDVLRDEPGPPAHQNRPSMCCAAAGRCTMPWKSFSGQRVCHRPRHPSEGRGCRSTASHSQARSGDTGQVGASQSAGDPLFVREICAAIRPTSMQMPSRTLSSGDRIVETLVVHAVDGRATAPTPQLSGKGRSCARSAMSVLTNFCGAARRYESRVVDTARISRRFTDCAVSPPYQPRSRPPPNVDRRVCDSRL
jgi:hypothetical protein